MTLADFRAISLPVILSARPYYSVNDLFSNDGAYECLSKAWHLVEPRVNHICKRIQANARSMRATTGARRERHRQQIHLLRGYLRKLDTDIYAPREWPMKGAPATPVYRKDDK